MNGSAICALYSEENIIVNIYLHKSSFYTVYEEQNYYFTAKVKMNGRTGKIDYGDQS